MVNNITGEISQKIQPKIAVTDIFIHIYIFFPDVSRGRLLKWVPTLVCRHIESGCQCYKYLLSDTMQNNEFSNLYFCMKD